MRGGWALGWVLGVALVSCGLETVPSLTIPDVDYNNSELVEDTQISFRHVASRYSGSPFLEYWIYYKIYPVSSNFGRLLSDRDSLSSSPTVNQLTNIGYQRFSMAATEGGSRANASISPGSGDALITLDFSALIDSSASESLPVVLINGKRASNPNLYRTLTMASPNDTFASLRRAVKRDQDMSQSMTNDHLKDRQFEINVFIAAYGLTPTLVEVFSSPVPWGVIRTIE